MIPVFSPSFFFGSGSAFIAASNATGSNKGVLGKLETSDVPALDPLPAIS